jgi:hypothetical protein
MAPDRRTVRASELGAFLYCRRAWWYQRQDIQPENVDELSAGDDFHEVHSSQARLADGLFRAALVLMAAAVLAIIIFAYPLLSR